MPAGGIEARLTRAKLCNCCGYVHPRDEADVDLCVHCGTRLDGATSQYPQALFQQPTVRAQRWTRITSEEEERVREGYLTTTHFRTGAGAVRERRILIEPETGRPILSALYLPQAQLWRINHGWRKSSEQVGFIIDSATGRWRSREDADDANDGDRSGGTLVTGIRPFVTDSRNLLLLQPSSEGARDEGFLRSLAYALRRALQIEYQIEEREVEVELIGREENENLLFWEAAEGGIGVWERLIAEPREFRKLALRALEILHFDPSSGQLLPDWEERCTAACYDCLLSYSNQPDHRYLDRHKVRDFLFVLSRSAVGVRAGQSLAHVHRVQHRPMRKSASGIDERCCAAFPKGSSCRSRSRDGADFHSTVHDFIQVPRPEAYFEPINWHRTALHELGHNAEPSVMPRRAGFARKARPDRRCHAA